MTTPQQPPAPAPEAPAQETPAPEAPAAAQASAPAPEAAQPAAPEAPTAEAPAAGSPFDKPAAPPAPAPANPFDKPTAATPPPQSPPAPPQQAPAPQAPAAVPQQQPVPAQAPPAPPPQQPYGGEVPGQAGRFGAPGFGGPPPPQQHQHPAPPAPAGGSYTSPIPIARTHLGHALASEWTKIRSVRSTVWTLAVMFTLSVGIGMLAGFGFSTTTHAEVPVLSPGFYGIMFGQLGVITLGVLVITSEYSTRMIRTTMTACPNRTRVLTAKAIVFFLLSFTVTLLATGITAVINHALLSGAELGSYLPNDESEEAGEAVANASEWLSVTVGASLYVALLGVFALALGALLRSAPGAITIMIGLVLMPIVVSFFLLASERTQDLSEKLREYSPLNGLSSMHRFSMVGDADVSGWPLLGVLAVATAVMLAGAYVRIAVRDV